MRLRVTANTAKGDAQLDAWAAGIQDRAIPRAINTLIDQAETAGFRKIAEVYQIPPRTMAQYASLKSAAPGDLQAEITVKGRGFPLSLFRPRQTARGVQVTIKGRTFVIPHTFMTKRFGQHVFARGSYGGKGGVRPTGERFGRFVFGKGRLPINKLYSLAPPDAFSNKDVVGAMDERVAEQTAKVLKREIDAVRRGF